MVSLQSFRLAVLAGFFTGLACAIFFQVVFSFGMVNPIVRIFDVWIPAISIFFVLIYIRALRNPQMAFHFWEGLMLGNVLAWTAGLFSGLFIWLFSLYDAEPFQNFLASSQEFLRLSDRDAPEKLKLKNLEQLIAEIGGRKATYMIWDEIIKKVQYSFLIVPIIALILRRRSRENSKQVK